MINNKFRNKVNMPRHIRETAIFLLGLLVILFLYLSYIQVIDKDYLATHPLNRRNTEAAKKIEYGSIADKHGNKLALSVKEDGVYVRRYPYGAVFAHVVGYDTAKYGKAGIEAAYNGYLSGNLNSERQLGAVSHLFTKTQGNNIRLTLDAKLQETAFKALGNHRGAVVALSPKTGEVLALVSKPSFNPEAIESIWQEISQDKDSPLLDRTLQGLYPPGSTLKVMMAEAALHEGITTADNKINCAGTLKIGTDYTLTEINNKAHGKVNLEEALAVSCNITFGTLALELGRDKMAKTFERYGFKEELNSDLAEAKPRLPSFNKLSDGDLAQTGIGQGSLLVTPLRMAMLAGTIANQGVMMKPYLVSEITSPDGGVFKKYSAEKWLTLDAKTAELVRQMMVSVVRKGTGQAAQLPGISVAGKTGTAENPHGKDHSWFIGFAPADNPEIAIAVIVENAGGGSVVAAPIAREVFAQGLR
ncbi:MAG: cell division protein FtsI [Pelosinus sp.]|nr:cell division protein FtsI [Pelosinus sp.]